MSSCSLSFPPGTSKSKETTKLEDSVTGCRSPRSLSITISLPNMIADRDDDDYGKLVKDASNRRSNRTGSSSGILVASSSSPRTPRRGTNRESEMTITTTKEKEKEKAHPRAECELEVRIEQIRRRYRQQEHILEEEIARLEQTYRFALEELDKTGNHLSKADSQDDRRSADENWDWESTSEYPPTEPRGMSRSPSPVFAY